MQNPYTVMDQHAYSKSIEQIWNKNYNTSAIACNTSLRNPFENNLKLAILLTDTDIEANWISKQLNTYHQIYIINSTLTFSKMIEWDQQTLINQLDKIYDNSMEKMSNNINLENTSYCFLPVHINQIPVSLYKVFVDYIYCHNIMVLHIYRQALIASYLHFKHDVVSLEYVNNIESNREKLEKMIKLHPKYIKHQRFDYEDLTGMYSNAFWNALIIWIDNGLSVNKINDIMSTVDLQQHRSCLFDVTEWNVIETTLNGTASYYLCKKYAYH